MTSGETGAGAGGRDTGERLAAAVADAEQAAYLGRQLDEARGASSACQEAVARAKASLAEEDRDVARLESFSWASVLAHVRGTHSDDVRREDEVPGSALPRAGRSHRPPAHHASVVSHRIARRARLAIQGLTTLAW